MKNQRIVSAVAMLCEAFNRKPTDATFAAYEIGLAGLAPEAVERATASALQRCKFMPTPAELREFSGAGGSSFEAMAERAWHQLAEAVRTLGPDRSVNFADGAINAAIRLAGGWRRLCSLEGEAFATWARKDFAAAYVRLCRDGCPEDLRAYHPGNFEIENLQWLGRKMPGGQTYRHGMLGTEVCEIAAEGYQPALPAPAAQQRIEGPIAARLGVETVKRIGATPSRAI